MSRIHWGVHRPVDLADDEDTLHHVSLHRLGVRLRAVPADRRSDAQRVADLNRQLGHEPEATEEEIHAGHLVTVWSMNILLWTILLLLVYG